MRPPQPRFAAPDLGIATAGRDRADASALRHAVAAIEWTLPIPATTTRAPTHDSGNRTRSRHSATSGGPSPRPLVAVASTELVVISPQRSIAVLTASTASRGPSGDRDVLAVLDPCPRRRSPRGELADLDRLPPRAPLAAPTRRAPGVDPPSGRSRQDMSPDCDVVRPNRTALTVSRPLSESVRHNDAPTDPRRSAMRSAPIILVPGFWLGGWAWDEVAGYLRDDGFDVTALTLPGMDSKDADRSNIGFKDHVEAIVRQSRRRTSPSCSPSTAARGSPDTRPVTACRSGSPRWSTSTARRGSGPRTPDFTDAEKPLDWAELSAEENLDGVSEEQQATFRERGVPLPGGVLRDAYPLTNDARNDIPSTLICTAYTAADYQKYAAEEPVMSGWPESGSCATQRGSTCRRATGRCSPSRASSRTTSPRSLAPPRTRSRPDQRAASAGRPELRLRRASRTAGRRRRSRARCRGRSPAPGGAGPRSS